MKTDYPDLEKSENINFWKHLLNWVWNKPRWLADELYEKYFLTTKKELLKTKFELDMLKIKVEQLELTAKIHGTIMTADNVIDLIGERHNK